MSEAAKAAFLNHGSLLAVATAAYRRLKSASSDNRPEDALVAVLFSAATLEAFIADFAYLGKGAIGSAFSEISEASKIIDELEESRASVKAKYLMAKAMLTGGKTYDKGGRPFQDFTLLFSIRDAIVHHKPQVVGDKPHALVKKLAEMKLCDHGNSETWISQISTPAVAGWACNTAIAMIRSIVDSIHPSSPLKHLWEHYEPLG